MALNPKDAHELKYRTEFHELIILLQKPTLSVVEIARLEALIALNPVDKNGDTALIFAIKSGNWNTIEELVALGVDLIINTQTLTDLFINNEVLFENLEEYMAEKIGLAQFSKLLKKSNMSQIEEGVLLDFLNTISPDKLIGLFEVPALIYALYENNLKAANILIACGANTNCLHMKHLPYDESILSSIVNRRFSNHLGNEKNLIYFICEHGADPNLSFDLYTPMATARRIRNTSFIKIIDTYQKSKHTLESCTEFKTKSETKIQGDMKQHFNKVKSIKDSGHIFGFSDKIGNIPSTGHYSYESYRLLESLLHSMNDEWVQKYFDAPDSCLKKAFNLAIEWLECVSHASHQDFIDLFNTGNPVILPIAYSGHAFTMIAWNNILIICNRGEGQSREHTIDVYKIPNDTESKPGKITLAFLQAIMPTDSMPSSASVFEAIRAFTAHKKPMMVLLSHSQKHGTCSFANIKSALYPLLCFIKLLEHAKLGTHNLNSELLEAYLSEPQKISVLKTLVKTARLEYKSFTNGMRNFKLDALYEEFNLLPKNTKARSLYLAIFECILYQHHGQSYPNRYNPARVHKMQSELYRSKKCLNALSTTLEHKTTYEDYLKKITQNSKEIACFFKYRSKHALMKTIDANNWKAIDDILLLKETKILEIDLDAIHADGDTALIKAIASKQWVHAKKLIALGANVTAKGKNNLTPLMHASMHNNLEIVKLLVQKGADDFDISDVYGNRAYEWADLCEQTEIMTFLEKARKASQTLHKLPLAHCIL